MHIQGKTLSATAGSLLSVISVTDHIIEEGAHTSTWSIH